MKRKLFLIFLILFYFISSAWAQNFKEIQKAAEKGDAEAQFQLGNLHMELFGSDNDMDKDGVNAFNWWIKAAQQGHLEAQWKVAERLEAIEDATESIKWYHAIVNNPKAGAKDKTSAFYHIGSIYKQILENEEEAAPWYQKASDQGHALAQYQLGHLYMGGRGVPQDANQALFLFLKAADQGVPEAHMVAAIMLKNGEDVPKNLIEAYKWALLTAHLGIYAGIGIRDELAPVMTPAQIAEAEQRSREWLKAHEK